MGTRGCAVGEGKIWVEVAGLFEKSNCVNEGLLEISACQGYFGVGDGFFGPQIKIVGREIVGRPLFNDFLFLR
jgi:hypothetical protein